MKEPKSGRGYKLTLLAHTLQAEGYYMLINRAHRFPICCFIVNCYILFFDTYCKKTKAVKRGEKRGEKQNTKTRIL